MACCTKDRDNDDDDIDRSDVPPDFKAQLEVIILSNGTAEQTEAAVHAMKALFDEVNVTSSTLLSPTLSCACVYMCLLCS
jgi:hypothetical protein